MEPPVEGRTLIVRVNLFVHLLTCVGTMNADPGVKRFWSRVVIFSYVAMALGLILGTIGVVSAYSTGVARFPLSGAAVGTMI